jgi:hypothetical protein
VAERLRIFRTNCPHDLPVNVFYEGHKMSGLGEGLGVEALNTVTHLKDRLVQLRRLRHGLGVTVPAS